MLHLFLLALLAFTSTLLSADIRDDVFDDSEKTMVQYPAWFKDSFLDLEENLKEAETAGKKGLMLYFGTVGCAYCRRFLDRSLGNPDIAWRVQEHFDSIGFEIFDDLEMVAPDGRPMRVKDFAKHQGAEFSPTVVFLNTSGQRLLRIVGYYPRNDLELRSTMLSVTTMERSLLARMRRRRQMTGMRLRSGRR